MTGGWVFVILWVFLLSGAGLFLWWAAGEIRWSREWAEAQDHEATMTALAPEGRHA